MIGSNNRGKGMASLLIGVAALNGVAKLGSTLTAKAEKGEDGEGEEDGKPLTNSQLLRGFRNREEAKMIGV